MQIFMGILMWIRMRILMRILIMISMRVQFHPFVVGFIVVGRGGAVVMLTGPGPTHPPTPANIR